MLEAVGVGFLVAVPVLGADFVLVERTFSKPWNKQFPDPTQALLHGVVTTIPGVEITQDRHAQGMRCPKAEHHPGDAITLREVGAHPLPDVVVIALGKQMAIHVAHPFVPERPGVVLFVSDAAALDPHLVVAAGVVAERCFKHPGVIGCGHQCFPTALQQRHAVGFRHPHPNGPARIAWLRAEDRERVIVPTIRETFAVLNHPVEDCRATHGRAVKWARC